LKFSEKKDYLIGLGFMPKTQQERKKDLGVESMDEIL
jgi:hypothetical protein